MQKIGLYTFMFWLTLFTKVYSQNRDEVDPPKNWFLLDMETDHFPGVSVERAYQTILKNIPSRNVLVAIIDSGVDIEHEDLKRMIWTNKNEISNNGIDDDKNGYVDDIHGWNFIGGQNENVSHDTYEITREYSRLKKIFGDRTKDEIDRKEKTAYKIYRDIKNKFEQRKATQVKQYEEYSRQYLQYTNINTNLKIGIDTLKVILKCETLTRHSVDTMVTQDLNLLFYKGLVIQMLKTMDHENIDSLQAEIQDVVDQLKSAKTYFETIVTKGYNEGFNSRQIVGDHEDDFYEKNYGNNDVKGTDAEHGTHVAGIIGADRTNNLGMQGICNNVTLMPIRVVPNGDERDKDVANAIYYAVDNGAQIINMSFGKSYSPQKIIVDRAVRYAVRRGVVIVHAAGNDAQDLDKQKDFPNRYFLNGKKAKNWIEVGASGWDINYQLMASFSNYGKKSVDLLAPGKDVFSTTPENRYKNESGTSMACPITTGVVALLMVYFPQLSPGQVIHIIKKSVYKFDKIKIAMPDGKSASLSQLTITGGIINANRAIKLAVDLTK